MFNPEGKFGINIAEFVALQMAFNVGLFAKPVVIVKEAIDLGIKEDASADGGFVRVFEVKDARTEGQVFIRFPVTTSDDVIHEFFAKQNIRVVPNENA